MIPSNIIQKPAQDAGKLREVVIYGLKPNREAVMFPDYAGFLAAVEYTVEEEK